MARNNNGKVPTPKMPTNTGQKTFFSSRKPPAGLISTAEPNYPSIGKDETFNRRTYRADGRGNEIK